MTAPFAPPPASAEPTPKPAGVAGTLLGELTRTDLDTMVLYLERAQDRAERIRENTPAGSYLDRVLERTIAGIALELTQLRYLLGESNELPSGFSSPLTRRRMHPAL
ncbi:hypothetical protein GCM10011316_22420 [Roseibium aquae]|uniref:Uncharacterized protein n=1 Tax=Roseibium aquae TaxID=1323746 RepID=A0A916TKG5_9HYPH|nr:hypothetical protein [Roseibium aquae]GGB49815.1 hypothetical protein GCM10011316_22420 [Roseibium aquae]